MNRISFYVTFAMILLATALTSLSAEMSFDEARSHYDRSLVKIEKDHANNMKTWTKNYLNLLEQLQDNNQAKGDLEALVTVKGEIARFKKDESLGKDHVVNGSGTLERRQQKFVRMRDDYNMTRNRNIIVLRDKYIRHLSKVRKTLTSDGEMDAAMRVREEIVRVNESKIVTSAEFALAVNSVHDQEKKEHDAESNDRIYSTPARDTSTSGVEVHPAGEPIPNLEGINYKQKSLSRTNHSPMNSSVSVIFMEAAHSKREGEKHQSRYSRSSSEFTYDYRTIRLGLHTTGGKKLIRDLYVHIEYFCKPIKKGGKSDPELYSSSTAYIRALEQERIHVDFPPVSFRKELKRHDNLYRGRRTKDRSGDKYYGSILSILARDGKILYQGVSAPRLKEFASETVPDALD